MANPFDVFDNPVTRGARDVGVAFSLGANGLVKMAGDLATLTTGKKTALSELAQKNIEYLQRQKSPELIAAEQEREAAVNAEENPVYQAWSYIKSTASNPLLAATTAAETAPSSVGAGALGAGARMAAGKLLVKKGSEFATKVGVGTALGAGTAMQAADVGGDQFDELLRTLEGMDDETAMQIPQVADLVENKGSSIAEAKGAIALDLARKTAFGAGAVSALSQLAPGGRTIERALVGGTKKAAGQTLGRTLLAGAKGAAGEATQESFEEAGGQVTKNILARPVEPERELTAGVGPAVGQAVMGAGALGGAAGIVQGTPSRPTTQPAPEGQTTAGKTGEAPASAATKTSIGEAPEAALEQSERMTPEQFFAAVNIRQARLLGGEPNPEDVKLVSEVSPPEVLVNPEEMRASIDETQQALDEWKSQNPSAPQNIVIVFDPGMLHNGYGIQGAFNPNDGSIFINSAFVAPENVGKIASHEWAHQTLATPEGQQAFADFVQREIPQTELDALAARYGTQDRRVLLEEWIAENQEKAPGVIERIVARIREWLAGVGIVDLSDAEVADIMLRTLRQQAENRIQPDTFEAMQPAQGERFSLTEQPKRISGVIGSPSVTDINYDRAKRNLTSANQARFKSQISEYAPEAEIFDAVGDWVDGSENSVAAIFQDRKSGDELQRLAAQVGLAGDQKAVLWWRTEPEGADAIHEMIWPKGVSMDEARQAMIDVGLENRTLIQTPEGVRGFVFDQGRKNLNKIEALNEHETQPSLESSPAAGDFLGSWTSRAEGRRAYRRVLGSTPQAEARARELRSGEVGGVGDSGQPETRFSLAQTKTPEFKAWFGDSQIVDRNGDPRMMYHGTFNRRNFTGRNEDFTVFRPKSQNKSQPGVVFASPNPQLASEFTGITPSYLEQFSGDELGEKRPGARVYPVYVKAENPFDYENPRHVQMIFGDEDYIELVPGSEEGGPYGSVDYDGVSISRAKVENGDWVDIEYLLSKIKDAGFDGAYVSERDSTGVRAKNIAVFDSDQLKSATGNVGAFGQRPVTAEEARRMGLTEEEAAKAQAEGDIRFSLTEQVAKGRDTVLAAEAQKLRRGETTAAKYARKVEQRMPLRPFEAVPEPATDEDILRGLANRMAGETLKRELKANPEDIEGQQVEARLDIPSYEDANVWTVTLHLPRERAGAAGKVLAYTPTAILRDVSFTVNETAAMNVAAGARKSSFATMDGTYVPATARSAYEQAVEAKESGDWVEIGMNPIRHSYFYDKADQRPVVSAEEVIQVGGLVLGRGVQYGEKSDRKFSLAQTKTPEFKRWFGDSKIVDADGNPQVMYHGTSSIRADDFTVFEGQKQKALGFLPDDAPKTIFFTPDLEFASGFSGIPNAAVTGSDTQESEELASRRPGARVYPAFIKAENPFDYNNPDHVDLLFGDKSTIEVRGKRFGQDRGPEFVDRDLVEEGRWQYIEMLSGRIKAAGFDSFYVREAVFENLGDPDGEVRNIAVFEPTQIKSATGNTGAFDPENPDIRYSLSEEPVEETEEEIETEDPNLVVSAEAERERPDLPPTSALNTLYAQKSAISIPEKGKRTNGQVAEQLRQAALKYWGRKLDSSNLNPDEIERIVDNGVEEVIAGLKASNHAGNWYTTAIRRAMAVAAVLHPELGNDALAQKTGFKDAKAAEVGLSLAMAITSQNLNVRENTQFANEQFEILKQTGRFDPSKKYGAKMLAISGNLRLANALLDKVGWEGAEDFLNREYTVKELNQIASEVLGQEINIAGKVDDLVNGSAIFGPKIGGGFFQNLRANFNPVTVDLWMRRTWGRWTGDVLPEPLDARRLARMLEGMREAGIPLPEQLRSIRTVLATEGRKTPTLTEKTAQRILSDPAKVNAAYEFAAEQNSRWNKIYSEVRQNITPEQAAAVRAGELSLEQLNRQQQKSLREKRDAWLNLEGRPPTSSKEGREAQKKLFEKLDAEAGRTAELTNKELSKFKPEWAKSARVITTLLKPVDVPSDLDRRVIVDVVNRIRAELENQGVNATNADIQAILWYPEKDIWAKLAGKKESELKLSYDDEFLRVAEIKGLGDKARDAAGRVGN